jgi:hypothetical protein
MEISIALCRAGSLAWFKAACCRSQAFYLFVNRLGILVELHEFRFFGASLLRSLSSTLPTESLFISAIVTSLRSAW